VGFKRYQGVVLVQNLCEIRNDSAPEAQGYLESQDGRDVSKLAI
jgi:hypothetical protein